MLYGYPEVDIQTRHAKSNAAGACQCLEAEAMSGSPDLALPDLVIAGVTVGAASWCGLGRETIPATDSHAALPLARHRGAGMAATLAVRASDYLSALRVYIRCGHLHFLR